MNNRFLHLIAIGFCFFCSPPVVASPAKGGTAQLAGAAPVVVTPSIAGQEEPNVKIIADSLECDQIKSVCVAVGNAFIEKLNDPDKKTIQADRIEMYFEKAESSPGSSSSENKDVAGNQKAKEFHARGSVVVTLKDTIILGDRAIYIPDTDVAEVFENVSVTSGRNEVVGNYGRADLKTGEYKVLNSDGRVTALIFQQQ